MASKIQIRRDTASNWTSVNPTLSNGELGLETDTKKLKAGDGSTAWTSLAYYTLATAGYITETSTATLTNKTINYANNTLTGVVGVTATQTLTNKTLTSPVLGGTTSTASGNIVLSPATQIVEVKGNGSSVEGQIKLNCHANTHGQTVKAQPHSESVTNTMLLPKGSSSTLVSEIGLATLTNKTMVDIVYPLSGVALLAANGGVQTKTVGAAITFTDSLVTGDAIVLMLEAGASYTVTWPTMQWVTSAGNVAPTLTAKDTIVLWKVGSVLHGAYTGSYV